MKRKKLIIILAVAAVIVIILSGVSRIALFLHHGAIQKRLINDKKYKISELTKDFQEYLNTTAVKITQVPVDQQIIAQITSDTLKKSPVTRLYLWMSNPQGEFIFGTPNPVFERMNKAYDKYRDIIAADGYYLDRNDFLLKLVHRNEDIKWSQFEERTPTARSESKLKVGDNLVAPRSREQEAYHSPWRFYKEDSGITSYWEPVRLELSAPVVDMEKQMIGTLYLKVDDYSISMENNRLVKTEFMRDVLEPASEVIFIVSLMLLWFLLPSWVYIDARLRDVKNPTRWALLTAVTFCFAWMIYLIIRPSELKSFHCPQCTKELNGTRAFCPYCGFDLSESFCPQCQYPLKAEWQFCPSCRTDLTHPPQKPEEPAPEINK